MHASSEHGSMAYMTLVPSWAKCLGVRLSSPVFSLQLYQQHFGLLEVRGIKALSKPAVDRGQQLVGCDMLALLLPQACQAHGGAQLQRFRLLAAGNGEGLLEAGLSLRLVLARARQQQFPPEPIHLRRPL